MLSVLLLDMLYEEETSVSACLESAFNKRELPMKRLMVYRALKQLLDNIDEQLKLSNVFITSFSGPEESFVKLARAIRLRSEKLFIVFVVDKTVDISTCVRPSVRPAGVLFIPFDRERLYQTIKEIYVEFSRLSKQNEGPAFIVKSEGEYYSVHTDDISFFESRGKKIAIKTEGQEIQFYSNFDTVLSQLPENFIRCHKGYIVNTNLIAKTNFTDMTLTLRDKAIIPVSRTYRDEVRSVVLARGGAI